MLVKGKSQGNLERIQWTKILLIKMHEMQLKRS